MKTFEERYTAWIDGKLQGADLAAFERELEDRSAAEADRQSVHQLGDLMRRYSSCELRNADFFNHQLLARIERDADVDSTAAPVRSFSLWPWLRLAVAGLAAVALGWGIARVTMPTPVGQPPRQESAYMAKIIDPKPLEPGVSASVIEDVDDNLTVLWLDGLEYLPASYELQ